MKNVLVYNDFIGSVDFSADDEVFFGVSTFALGSGWRGLRGGRLLQVAQHRLTQDGVDAGLVALAVTFEPSHDILVDAD